MTDSPSPLERFEETQPKPVGKKDGFALLDLGFDDAADLIVDDYLRTSRAA